MASSVSVDIAIFSNFFITILTPKLQSPCVKIVSSNNSASVSLILDRYFSTSYSPSLKYLFYQDKHDTLPNHIIAVDYSIQFIRKKNE